MTTSRTAFLLLAFSTLLLFGSSSRVLAQTWSFSPGPDGSNALGAPGSPIGWGYTLTNESNDRWLWVTTLSFEGGAGSRPRRTIPVR